MIGQTLAHYEILGELGAGGMGVVYRALDSRLGRQVAIKALPDAFAGNPERLARFEREARTLASLNHPNIGSIHGLEEVDGRRFLVLELVEGMPLAERLKGGPIPTREALELARQITEGLEAAHEAGVVHRDLKPGNIQVTPEGQAKILDFGLAKPMGTGSAVDLSLSPTMTYSPTEAGVLLGTAAYMSPEQARGQAVDRRADIWAFGCVLYEMLTGQRAFPGATVTDLLAAIVREEPDSSRLPRDTPWRVRELLERCFEKEARFRLRDIGDARIELHEAITHPEEATPGAAPTATGRGRGRSWIAAALGGVLVASVVWWLLDRADTPATELTRVSISTPEGWRPRHVLISPDGRTLVYVAVPEGNADNDARAHLRAHRLDQLESVRIPSSERADSLAFSPDGELLAFVAPEQGDTNRFTIFTWKVGGETPPLAVRTWDPSWKTPEFFVGLAWLPDGDLATLATGTPEQLVRIPMDGRTQGKLIPLSGVSEGSSLTLIEALPSGGVLADLATWEGGYAVHSVLIDPDTGEVRVLARDAAHSRFSPTGHLLFNRRDQLLAAPFDLRARRTTGPAVTVLGGIRSSAYSLRSSFGISRTGTLVHLGGGEVGRHRRLEFFGADGLEPWAGDQVTSDNTSMDVSADGRRVALTVMSRGFLFEVWGSELERPALRRLASLPEMDCQDPVLSAQARLLAYACSGERSARGIYVSPVDGSNAPRLLIEREPTTGSLDAGSFSPDNLELLVTRVRGDARELLSVSLRDESWGEERLLTNTGYAGGPAISPDGSLLAYFGEQTGRPEVFLRSRHPDGSLGPVVLVGSGTYPDWDLDSSGGLVLRYFTPEDRVVKTIVSRGGELGPPRPVLDFGPVRPDLVSGDYASDGRYLLMLRGEDEVLPDRIELALGFDSEIARLAADGR